MAKRHMKMCSTSVMIKELQIKTIVRYHFTIVRMVIIKKIKNNKCSGNSAQCYAAAWMGGKSRGEWIHIHVGLSLFALHLKLPTNRRTGVNLI